jgi:acyl dehydratase
VVKYTTSLHQALTYRLSGDRNPLHSDPTFAARGGFERPILHGLCTYGFTGRGLLQGLCNNDASAFQHIEGRFASPVIPGEELTISMWETGTGEAVFTTAVGSRLVIDQGLCRFRP